MTHESAVKLEQACPSAIQVFPNTSASAFASKTASGQNDLICGKTRSIRFQNESMYAAPRRTENVKNMVDEYANPSARRLHLIRETMLKFCFRILMRRLSVFPAKTTAVPWSVLSHSHLWASVILLSNLSC